MELREQFCAAKMTDSSGNSVRFLLELRTWNFRGIWAWDANQALVMSSGLGPHSRLYLTEDGGSHWKMLFQNPDERGFWDGILFLNRMDGFLWGDPVGGRFVLMRTYNGGASWARDNSPELAANAKGEGAFAASNSSLAASPGGEELFCGTGGPGGPRVFHLHLLKGPMAAHWSVSSFPLAGGVESAGVFSLAFRDRMNGVAVGGDYNMPKERSGTAAITHDGGKTWTASREPPAGFRSAVAWSAATHTWITAGSSGGDISRDDGQTWEPLGEANWNVLSLPWIAGPEGAVAKIEQAMRPR